MIVSQHVHMITLHIYVLRAGKKRLYRAAGVGDVTAFWGEKDRRYKAVTHWGRVRHKGWQTK